MTDEKTKQLENRIDKLESTIEKMMPSRRDALKMGGAALVGGAAMSGTASAGTNQVGTIGASPNDLVDIESEDINNADTITTQDIDVSQNVNGADTSTAANGEALTSDGAGGLAFATVGGGFDPNFSYVDQTANRSFGTTFTNNTGSALYVNVNSIINQSETIRSTFAQVDDQNIVQQQAEISGGTFQEFDNRNISFFVPDGSTYLCNSTASLNFWIEAEV